jgi:hypothetical protein
MKWRFKLTDGPARYFYSGSTTTDFIEWTFLVRKLMEKEGLKL